MKKYLSLVIIFLALGLSSFDLSGPEGQYFTKNGKVRFYSETPVETIEAINNSALAILDINTGELQVSMLMKGFVFEKALMQEHFNENYVESDKYPKAKFTGRIDGWSDIDFSAGTTEVSASGVIEIHGVKQDVEAEGSITFADGEIVIQSEFDVKPADHEIGIPSMVQRKIAESIQVYVDAKLIPYEK